MTRNARPQNPGRAGQHDLDAEKIVLGAMMMSAGAVAEARATVTAADYYRPAHQVIHDAILGLSRRGDPHDPVAVANELKTMGELHLLGGKGHLYLIECIEVVPAAASAGYYAQIVAVKASLRRVREVGTRLIQASESDDPRLAELLDFARSQLGQIGSPRGADAFEAAIIDLEPAAEFVMPPVLICQDLLYLGAVHTLSGPPDCGKTTLACWWMLQAVRDNRGVLFLDEEGGREIVTEKFQALGAKTAERIGYVEFPARTWNAADVAMLAEVLDKRKPAIVAWDSSAAFLSRAGLDENAAADVTRFYSHVLAPAARLHNSAVLIIDHDTKNGEPSRYARGSGAKLAATDVAYKITPVKPFSKTENGVSKLMVTKDRRGWLHRAYEAAFLAESLGMNMTVKITQTAADTSHPELAPAEQKVLEALDSTPHTIPELTDRIKGSHGHGLRRETASKALNKLMRLGLADKIDAPHGHDLWTVTDAP